MKKKKHYLGIDIGSGSCKVCLMEESGNVVCSASREYSPRCARPGWFEQDPAEWYDAFVACLKRISGESGVDGRDIAAAAATGQMKGATFIGRSGEVVRKSILWNDLRNVREVEEAKARYGDSLSGLSLNPFNTTSAFAKALWLKNNEPRNWERTSTIVFPKDFITYKLTGVLQTDVTEAAGFCFYDARSRRWWPDDVIGRFGFPVEKLPDISPSTQEVGGVSARAAEETGLKAGTPVVAGGSDATIESLAIGLIGSRQCKIRLGTAGALVTVVDGLDRVEKGKYYVWPYIVPGTFMLDNNTRSCAQSTAWFRSVFMKDEASSDAAYKRMAEEAAVVPPGSEGLFFHPYLLGEDSPYWDTALEGSYFGLHAGHTRGHCARAIYEGTAFALRDARSAFGSLVEGFSEYLMVGGGTKNPVWTSIIADVLGVDATIPLHADAAKGACMIAAIGTKAFAGYEEAIERCVRSDRLIRFNEENHEKYSELFFRYREIKTKFDGLYKT